MTQRPWDLFVLYFRRYQNLSCQYKAAEQLYPFVAGILTGDKVYNPGRFP